MYLSSFHAADLKCFSDVALEFPANPDGKRSGWNVLLGVNGTGKSTLLQAMALTLVGPTIGSELLRLAERERWIRHGSDHATLDAVIAHTENDQIASGTARKSPYNSRLYISGDRSTQVEGLDLRQPTLMIPQRLRRSLESGPYSGMSGWFSAGYGPFRRLTGGGMEDDQQLAAQIGPAGRHVSLFRESAALSRCEPWLKHLHNTANDDAIKQRDRKRAEAHLRLVTELINSLLPLGVRIDKITSQNVTFVNHAGLSVELNQLSDGFRSFLSLTLDLLRQIVGADEWGEVRGRSADVQVDTEGVVFIDEADAHLHPTWQRDLGQRMCRVFPNIQFIISTHSPFIAQAARPGGLYVVHTDSDGQTTVTRDEESVRGWTADQILLSPLFGLSSTRDLDTDALMRRRQELLGQRRRQPAEVRELDRITAQLTARLSAPGDSLADHDMDQAMHDYLAKRRGSA